MPSTLVDVLQEVEVAEIHQEDQDSPTDARSMDVELDDDVERQREEGEGMIGEEREGYDDDEDHEEPGNGIGEEGNRLNRLRSTLLRAVTTERLRQIREEDEAAFFAILERANVLTTSTGTQFRAGRTGQDGPLVGTVLQHPPRGTIGSQVPVRPQNNGASHGGMAEGSYGMPVQYFPSRPVDGPVNGAVDGQAPSSRWKMPEASQECPQSSPMVRQRHSRGGEVQRPSRNRPSNQFFLAPAQQPR